MSFLENNNLSSTYQFGFRRKRSTELAATLLIDDIRKEIDRGNYTGAIFLDLSKAFDTISHGALLIKLRSYGICGSELDWFENYLFNRQQSIIYNNTTSNEYPIYRGVPQGSILGPALFLLRINYLHHCLQHSRIINYADDTVLYVSDQDSLTIEKKFNEDISNYVSNWLTENDLSLNLKKGKTESMLFGSPARLKKTTPLSIYVNNIEINFTKTYTYLGVLLDPSLNLNENFLKKYRKNSVMGLLVKLRPNLTTSATQTIYTSVAIPAITYCGIVDIDLNRSQTDKLNRLHKRAENIIKNGNERTTAQITPITTALKRRACSIVRKCISKDLPPPMDNYFEIMTHEQRTRNNNLSIRLPKVKTECARKGFYYQAAYLYNLLPLSIRRLSVENLFYKQLNNFNF